MDSSENASDTSPDALAIQLDGLRRMSPPQRIAKMCALSRQVRNMAFSAIRRRHPELDEEEVRLRFIELTYSRPLADDVRRWLREQDR